LNLSFSLGVGSTYQVAAGSWQAGQFMSAPGAVSVVGTLNATLSITGVALMVGSGAANAEPEFRKYSDNLLDCQRYYNRFFFTMPVYGGPSGGNVTTPSIVLSPLMRASPTVTQSGMTYNACTGLNSGAQTPNSINTYLVGCTANVTAFASGTLVFDADF
jgi:hypothetical protein